MNENPPEALGDKVKRSQTQKSFSSPGKSGMLYMNHLLGFIKDIAERHNSSNPHSRHISGSIKGCVNTKIIQ